MESQSHDGIPSHHHRHHHLIITSVTSSTNNNPSPLPPLPPPPPSSTKLVNSVSTKLRKKHKKPRKPTAEEDLVDGFAFLAFKNYDELKRAITLGEEKSESICVQLLRGSQSTPGLHHHHHHKRHCSTSPDFNQKKLKPSKKKPKKLMDQENGDGISGGDGGRAAEIPASPFATLNAASCDLSPKSRITKEPLFVNHLTNDTSPDQHFKPAKISDACSDIFPISRKDSCSTRVEESSEIKALPPVDRPPLKRSPPPIQGASTNPPVSPKLTTNGGKVNGHEGVSVAKSNGQTFFTPYATNTITIVNVKDAPTKDLSPTQNTKGSVAEPVVPASQSSNAPKCGSATGKVTPTSSKSLVFGSIARLLDSPTTSSSSSNRSSPSVVVSTNHLSPQQSISQAPIVTSGVTSGSRDFGTHSPRGHSPSRERDSYSSNVSSLSRSSVTPVSGSSHPPSNLSPQLPSLSYSKAASWLSSVPVPRPTPPPPHSLGSGATSYGVPPGLPHSSPSAMFAPPILPMSSPHPSSQPSVHFPPSPDPIYHGPSSSELVRRDLESRFLSAGDRGGGSSFMGRPGDLHSLLPPHQQNQSTNPALFAPPLFKEMPKVGMESPFYRTNLGISYGGFNGMLPPPPNMGTPFAPPSQLPTFTPKKTGRWNAMHVRIAWEIYQHQQKSGNGGSEVKEGPSNPILKGPSGGGGPSIPPDLFRPPSHMFPGLSRANDLQPGPPPFPSPLLSPHAPRGPPFDPSHHMFLTNPASHLGPPLGRYPGFGGLSSPFGGLSSLGSSLLSRDLAALAPLGSVQDQWNRLARGVSGMGGPPPAPGWPPAQETKTEARRGNSSPFRDRSPIRTNRFPVENGDTDSRSSRSSDSHSSTHKSRLKEDSSEKLSSRTNTPLSDISKSHSSRMYPSTSPVTTGWEGFAPRFSSQESFRLSLLQLGERERELARLPPTNSIRPPLFGNPQLNSSAGHLMSGSAAGHLISSSGHHPMSSSMSAPHPMSSSFSGHLMSSPSSSGHPLSSSQTLNGANSPKKEESMRSKEEPQSR